MERTHAGGGTAGIGGARGGQAGPPGPRAADSLAAAAATPEVATLLADAHADLGRVCAWMEGEALPGGPALLVHRARARLAAVRAYLAALDEELPPPAPGEVPGRSLARAAAERPGGRSAA